MSDSAAIIHGLMRPFPQEAIKSRPGGRGKQLSYIEGTTAVRRLIEVLDLEGYPWSFELIGPPSFLPWGKSTQGEEQTLVLVHGRLSIEGLGARDAHGVQVYTARGGEDLLKGAATDALKKCAWMFGLAIDLYGEDLEASARTTRVGRPPSMRTKLTSLLKAQGITSKTAANKAAKEQFGKDIDALDDADVTAWVKELEASEPVPF